MKRVKSDYLPPTEINSQNIVSTEDHTLKRNTAKGFLR